MYYAVEESGAYDNFINSIKSEVTKKQYTYLLKRYMNYLNYGSIDMLLQQPKVAETLITHYIVWLKSEQKLSAITVNQYVAAIMHFYAMNDIVLNRKKIGKYMGDYVRSQKDRAYTHNEISRLLDFCDERVKVLVLLLASTGIRIGAISDIRLKHLTKIASYEGLYRLAIYEGTKEEYYCFTTPEAAKAIDTYLESRARSGEKLTGNAPLIRQQFAESVESARNPKIMNTTALERILQYKLQKSGVTQLVRETEDMRHGVRRNEVALAHGFRKFVTTNMIRAKVNPEAREMLLGHRLPGTTGSYYRPDESELLQEYLKAVDLLTINEENRLKKKVEELTIEKSSFDVLRKEFEDLRRVVKSKSSSSSSVKEV